MLRVNIRDKLIGLALHFIDSRFMTNINCDYFSIEVVGLLLAHGISYSSPILLQVNEALKRNF